MKPFTAVDLMLIPLMQIINIRYPTGIITTVVGEHTLMSTPWTEVRGSICVNSRSTILITQRRCRQSSMSCLTSPTLPTRTTKHMASNLATIWLRWIWMQRRKQQTLTAIMQYTQVCVTGMRLVTTWLPFLRACGGCKMVAEGQAAHVAAHVAALRTMMQLQPSSATT